MNAARPREEGGQVVGTKRVTEFFKQFLKPFLREVAPSGTQGLFRSMSLGNVHLCVVSNPSQRKGGRLCVDDCENDQKANRGELVVAKTGQYRDSNHQPPGCCSRYIPDTSSYLLFNKFVIG